MTKTKINSLFVEKFRALNNVNIEFGEYVTVICGKNGTSKSSILGMLAQIFSFEKDYLSDEQLSFNQITGKSFKSRYNEHFRISEVFDPPGSMSVRIDLDDGYTGKNSTAKLELMKRKDLPRPVVRNNSSVILPDGNTSRNFTHPVIFLSLKRLYPIVDRDYKVIDFDYLKKHKSDFISLITELLNRSFSHATCTGGTISSAVAHGENYDQDSVSAGEDNAGQIALALMSFRKLKEEYKNYKGGLLLIDEADAGLFPTAQENLLKIFERECRELSLQVVITSHSPIIIEYAHTKSQIFRKRYKTIYLSDTYGDIQVMNDWQWSRINADISAKTIPIPSSHNSLPPVNMYFEDREASDFFNALLIRQPLKRYIKTLPDITLGCSNYFQLIQKNILEFSERSVICLDSDQKENAANKSVKTVIVLPGNLPPDQLIFEYLYNLPASDPFWENELHFTRDVFTNSASEVIREFQIGHSPIDLQEKVRTYHGSKKPREVFKKFYKDSEFHKLVTSGTKTYNPWVNWVANNPQDTNEFLIKCRDVLYWVMKNGHAVDPAKLTVLTVKLKKV